MIKVLIYILIATLIASCIPEESPVTPIERGEVQRVQLDTSMYEMTSFFSLDRGEFIANHWQYNWTLAFNTESNDHSAILNTGITVKARRLDTKDFESVLESDTPDSLFIDNPIGGVENTIFGNWWSENGTSDVFIVSAGVSERKIRQGVFKVQLRLNTDNTISVTYQKFGDVKKTKIIEKDNTRNYVYFSMITDNVELNEPFKTEYDLIFTAKTEFVPLGIIDDSGNDEKIQYQVRGVYLNPFRTEALEFPNVVSANQDTLEFIDIVYDDVIELDLSTKQNVIGYDWKQININADIYSINDYQYYIIKSQSGLLYKLNFIKFYSDFGERGFPEFEFKQL